MTETIKTYITSDAGLRQSLLEMEGFIGDMYNAELADDSTVDVSDSVTALNGLITALESRDAEITRLRSREAELMTALDEARRWIGSMPTIDSSGQDRFQGTLKIVRHIEAVLGLPDQDRAALSAADGITGESK